MAADRPRPTIMPEYPPIRMVMTTDGRPYWADALESALTNIWGANWEAIHIYDDSGDDTHRHGLTERAAEIGDEHGVQIITHVDGPRRGQTRMLQRIWHELTFDWSGLVFHHEDDFIWNEPIRLPEVAGVLKANPHLRQMAFKRQPWFTSERRAGGIIERNPDDYEDHVAYVSTGCTKRIVAWNEHRQWFTLNPCVYGPDVYRRGWPNGPKSERRHTRELLSTARHIRFGYWGYKTDDPIVEHIGDYRTGEGY